MHLRCIHASWIIISCISNLLLHGHIAGHFEVSDPCLWLTESQKCCFDNSRQYSAMGTMVRQLDAPFSVLSCKSSFYFTGMLSLRCSMIFLYVLFVSFLIYDLIFLIASSSTVCYIGWTVMRLVSSVVILHELLFSTSACSWKIGIANSPSLVGKDSNLRSSSWHICPPVIAGMNRFRTVFWFGRNKFLILRMVRMK